MNEKGKTIEASTSYFNAGFGCAEAVLMATAEYKGIASDLIPRIATGFCGGMGKTDSVCGAVTGGILALSLVFGRDHADDDRQVLNSKIQEFIHGFKKEYGSTACTGLTGCNLSTKEGLQKFNDLNMHSRCTEFVGEATRRVLEIL